MNIRRSVVSVAAVGVVALGLLGVIFASRIQYATGNGLVRSGNTIEARGKARNVSYDLGSLQGGTYEIHREQHDCSPPIVLVNRSRVNSSPSDDMNGDILDSPAGASHELDFTRQLAPGVYVLTAAAAPSCGPGGCSGLPSCSWSLTIRLK